MTEANWHTGIALCAGGRIDLSISCDQQERWPPRPPLLNAPDERDERDDHGEQDQDMNRPAKHVEAQPANQPEHQ